MSLKVDMTSSGSCAVVGLAQCRKGVVELALGPR